ncbi:hypothetical protein BDW67DRAFT_29933 [Aspergillus spinulosporus]
MIGMEIITPSMDVFCSVNQILRSGTMGARAIYDSHSMMSLNRGYSHVVDDDPSGLSDDIIQTVRTVAHSRTNRHHARSPVPVTSYRYWLDSSSLSRS